MKEVSLSIDEIFCVGDTIEKTLIEQTWKFAEFSTIALINRIWPIPKSRKARPVVLWVCKSALWL